VTETASLIPDNRPQGKPRERRIGHVGQAYLAAVEAKRERTAQTAKAAISAMHKAAGKVAA
jgi:hypothetical protein